MAIHERIFVIGHGYFQGSIVHATVALLQQCELNIITQPLYIPDLSSDCHLFVVECFCDRDDIKRFLNDLVASGYEWAYKNCHSEYKNLLTGMAIM